jgi:hypothetical protein
MTSSDSAARFGRQNRLSGVGDRASDRASDSLDHLNLAHDQRT